MNKFEVELMFSIVIPLYNKANHIQRAIDSILAQSITNFELIVINDGSTDGGEKVVENYSDKRVRLVNQKNGGESAARNRGIEESKAAYVAFLDADDSWEPFFLKTISEMISLFPDVGGYATQIQDSKLVVENANETSKNIFLDDNFAVVDNYFACLSRGYFPITSSSVCIKKKVLMAVGGFNESLKIGPDIDMWIRVFLNSKFALAKQFAATYHTDAENRSVERVDFTEQELILFLHLKDKYLNSNLKAEYYSELKEWISGRLNQIIIRYVYKNKKQKALRVLLNNLFLIKTSQKFYILTRLIAPNYLVELMKNIQKVET